MVKYLFLSFFLNTLATTGYAQKVDLGAGLYDIEAKNSSGKTNISNLGKISLRYFSGVTDSIDFLIGYSVLQSWGRHQRLGVWGGFRSKVLPFDCLRGEKRWSG